DYLEDKNTAFHSIGLKNIKKRIQLYYGKEYDLFIDSRLNQGTTVTIKIPVIKE
ncbi:MAG TPA: two-component sensor histidine kinase, partial [Lachnospiraceae bacterium]|nr:two-component sensor histidine kinase [Lachnospiraceae bacterium]